MSPARQENDPTPLRRRYLLHLSSVVDHACEGRRYVARIRPWTARSRAHVESRELAFADECEFIAAVNPLLPRGSDVRDVFEHIESPNGFFYLLHLSNEEARQLGWPPELRSGDKS
jgi:hypothetical protein